MAQDTSTPYTCHECSQPITVENMGCIYASHDYTRTYCDPCMITGGRSRAFDEPGACLRCSANMIPAHAGLFVYYAGAYAFLHCSTRCMELTRTETLELDGNMHRHCGRPGCEAAEDSVQCPDCHWRYCSVDCREECAPTHALRCRLRVVYNAYTTRMRDIFSVTHPGSWPTAEQQVEYLRNPTRESTQVHEFTGDRTCDVCGQAATGDAHLAVALGDRPNHLYCDGCYTDVGTPVKYCSECGWMLTWHQAMPYETSTRYGSMSMVMHIGCCGADCRQARVRNAPPGTGWLVPCPCGAWTGVQSSCTDCGSVYYCDEDCRSKYAGEAHEFRCRMAQNYTTFMADVHRAVVGHEHLRDWMECDLYRALVR